MRGFCKIERQKGGFRHKSDYWTQIENNQHLGLNKISFNFNMMHFSLIFSFMAWIMQFIFLAY